MSTHMEMEREKIERTLGKIEWLLARSEQANRCYTRAQMEAFVILQDSFKSRLDNMNAALPGVCADERV